MPTYLQTYAHMPICTNLPDWVPLAENTRTNTDTDTQIFACMFDTHTHADIHIHTSHLAQW